MKPITIIVLLLSASLFSQKDPHNIYSRITVKNRIIFWSNTYQCDSIKAVEYFKSSLRIPNENKGVVANQKTHCPGLSMYMYGMFKYNYLIKYSKNQYTITVSEIVFDNDIQYNFGTVSTSRSGTRIEDFEIKNKDGQLRNNVQSYRNQSCLDDFFIKEFTVNQ